MAVVCKRHSGPGWTASGRLATRRTLSQPQEVAGEQQRQERIEMDRERAARGDALAGAAVAVEDHLRDR